jgi:4-diphosphocytidyl-2-C-methyl-D-erythritol kinase
VRLRAYAKINLSLKVLGLRPDGFHELDSVMQSVSLFDLITLTAIPAGIELVTTNLRLPTDSKNLAYKAAELFFDRITNYELRITGVKIYLEKNIPLAAGLAGGSADAAAVLYGLNRLTGAGLALAELLKLGEAIGSDIPFCLTGGNCTVRGRGELVTRNPLHTPRAYVLVTPDVEVATKWAYETWDETQTSNFKLQNKFPGSETKSQNDLESVVVKKYPVIQKVKDKLKELGCGFTQMSGSGPTVFGVVNSPDQGERIIAALKKEYPRAFLVNSVERGVEEIG